MMRIMYKRIRLILSVVSRYKAGLSVLNFLRPLSSRHVRVIRVNSQFQILKEEQPTRPGHTGTFLLWFLEAISHPIRPSHTVTSYFLNCKGHRVPHTSKLNGWLLTYNCKFFHYVSSRHVRVIRVTYYLKFLKWSTRYGRVIRVPS